MGAPRNIKVAADIEVSMTATCAAGNGRYDHQLRYLDLDRENL